MRTGWAVGMAPTRSQAKAWAMRYASRQIPPGAHFQVVKQAFLGNKAKGYACKIVFCFPAPPFPQ